ncbi:MAG: COX15/CtaA family protein, partial [Pseudomonadota bacterium]
LSITEWAPVMGALPPLSDTDWQAAFAAYQETTEFKEQNNWMTLADFKPIFWWEWGHRFLGRFIGLVWFLGFVGFLVARRIPDGWTGRLLLPGVLGGIQGAIGWWMVVSGLREGMFDVASYRLAIHLGLAFVIFGLLLWLALRIRRDPVETLARRRRRFPGLMRFSGVMIALVFIQIVSGALVAGIDAGRGYPTWPQITPDSWLPPEPFVAQPLWANFFETASLVQFNHRLLAYFIVLVSLAYVWTMVRAGHAKIRAWGTRAGVVVLAQVALGIVTVMNAAPLHYALAHQALALALLGVLIHARFEAAYPAEQKISA